MLNTDSLKFNEQGLIPAIVQDGASGQILMMAWMNRESLDITSKEGYTCFYSRSRKALWRKGETSGNRQRVLAITADCDFDTLLIAVEPLGPACHTGAPSCFFNRLSGEEKAPVFSLSSLYELILGRKEQKTEGSYTSYLFEKGLDKILKKVGEESAEVIIAAKGGNRDELVCELADLCYHSLVLMAQEGLTPDDILRELEARHVIDKKEKQEKPVPQARTASSESCGAV